MKVADFTPYDTVLCQCPLMHAGRDHTHHVLDHIMARVATDLRRVLILMGQVGMKADSVGLPLDARPQTQGKLEHSLENRGQSGKDLYFCAFGE